MQNSAAPSKTGSTVTYLKFKERSSSKPADITPVRFPWTEELERRRKAVARWRGDDSGLKEKMMRD
jgi:hypothetical protein